MGAQKKMIQDDSTNSDIADLLLSWYQVKKEICLGERRRILIQSGCLK